MSEAAFTTRLTDEIKISPVALEQLSALVDSEDSVDGVRIFVAGGGCSGMSYGMTFVEQASPFDCVLERQGMKLYVDAVALSFLEGVEIDFQKEGLNQNFVFKNAFASSGGGGMCGGCAGAGRGGY